MPKIKILTLVLKESDLSPGSLELALRVRFGCEDAMVCHRVVVLNADGTETVLKNLYADSEVEEQRLVRPPIHSYAEWQAWVAEVDRTRISMFAKEAGADTPP